MIPLGGWPGRVILSSTGRFGVTPAEFATGGDFDSPLLACVDPGDENTEFSWVIRALPSSGTLAANDDGGMSHTGAADGSYTVSFGLYTWAPGGPGVYEGDTSFTTTFGASILCTESDVALALAGRQIAAVGLASEADQAIALVASVPGTVGIAAEVDAALALLGVQRRAVGLALETDAALALSTGTSSPVGLATESDTAFALAAVQRLVVGMASEVDTALAPGEAEAPAPAPTTPSSDYPANRSGSYAAGARRSSALRPMNYREDEIAELKAREIAAEDAAILDAIRGMFAAGAFDDLELEAS